MSLGLAGNCTACGATKCSEYEEDLDYCDLCGGLIDESTIGDFEDVTDDGEHEEADDDDCSGMTLDDYEPEDIEAMSWWDRLLFRLGW